MNSRRWLALCGSTAILAGGVLALAVTGPFGTPPRLIAYGGTLDQGGMPVTGPVPMTFFILNSATALPAAALWSEDYPAATPVNVVGGRFDVILGSRTPVTGVPDSVFQNGELYVAVRVAGVDLEGRQRLVTNPFAITAAQAQDFSVLGNLRVSGSATMTGAVAVNPTTDASVGLRVSTGTNSNVVIQPLAGQAFQAINFNGYFNGGEQRFNTSKQRWRMAADQRGFTDELFLDRWDGVSNQTVMRVSPSGNVALRGALTRVNVHCPATDVCTATCPNSTTIVFAMGGHGNNLTNNVAHTSGICGAQQEWMGSCLGGTSCTVDSGCTSSSMYLLCANQL